jgi:hypothetical protein
MKVGGANGIGAAGGPGRARPAGGGQGFIIPTPGASRAPAQVSQVGALSGVASLDALLALQDVGGPTERKRRAVRRAGRILDVLDEVKLGLLSGDVTTNDLQRLQIAVRDQRENTEDPGLEGILNEIETRAAVELAKLERGNYAS